MKKLSIIVLIVISIICCFAFSACGDEHVHQYGPWIVESRPTCTEPGVKVRYCACGETQTEIIPAKGHSFVGGVCVDCGALQG